MKVTVSSFQARIDELELEAQNSIGQPEQMTTEWDKGYYAGYIEALTVVFNEVGCQAEREAQADNN